MTEDDPLPEAVAELYASGPDEFVKRRSELADRYRSASQAVMAKRISGLRKPTRSAWIINQLIRSDPSVSAQLADLGEQLRAAQSSLDGAALRDLSLQRRQLIDTLARQAFTAAGQPAPPAAIRDEVTATLAAALADPQVADRVRAGTLERAAHSGGFGGQGFGGEGCGQRGGAQVLTLVRPSSGDRREQGGQQPAAARTGTTAAPASAGGVSQAHSNGTAPGGGPRDPAIRGRPLAKTTELAAVRARAERERRRHAIFEAEQAAAEADWVLDAAVKAEREQERTVQLLEEQLAEARHCLAAARRRPARPPPASAWRRRRSTGCANSLPAPGSAAA